MTPLIQKGCQFAPQPELAMWFDVGDMPPAIEKQSIAVEILMNLPFERTAIVGRDATGKDFCLLLHQGKGSVQETKGKRAVSVSGGSMWHKIYFDPFAYVEHKDGVSLYRKDKKINKLNEINTDEVMPVHRMVIATLSKLSNASTGYKPTPKNTFINKKRIAKGKSAISFDWTTVEIGPKQEKSAPQGGTHASPRLHDRRGHWRKHPSGKAVWVKPCKVGNASLGVVFHDYKVKTEA
jgi:hypothetical protein